MIANVTTRKANVEENSNGSGSGWWMKFSAVKEKGRLPTAIEPDHKLLLRAVLGGLRRCRYNLFPNMEYSRITFAGGEERDVPNLMVTQKPPTPREVAQAKKLLLSVDPEIRENDEELRVGGNAKPPYLNGGGIKIGHYFQPQPRR